MTIRSTIPCGRSKIVSTGCIKISPEYAHSGIYGKCVLRAKSNRLQWVNARLADHRNFPEQCHACSCNSLNMQLGRNLKHNKNWPWMGNNLETIPRNHTINAVFIIFTYFTIVKYVKVIKTAFKFHDFFFLAHLSRRLEWAIAVVRKLFTFSSSSWKRMVGF